MNLDNATILKLAEHLENAELQAFDVTKITNDHPDMDWDDAYAIQDEIRRRNFIPPESFPFATLTGVTYDTGDYNATMTRAIELADVAGFEARKAASAAKGLKRGLGYSAYIEACGIAPSSVAGALGARAGLFEAGEVRVHPTGKVTIFTGSHSHGQGHETTFAAVVAAQLGVDPSRVDILHSDTDLAPFGGGTIGSRSAQLGGSAAYNASQELITAARSQAAPSASRSSCWPPTTPRLPPARARARTASPRGPWCSR